MRERERERERESNVVEEIGLRRMQEGEKDYRMTEERRELRQRKEEEREGLRIRSKDEAR